MNNKRVIRPILLMILLFFPLLVMGKNYTISGYIKEMGSGEALINASVFDVTSKKGTVTNAYGFYSLTIPEGAVDLHVSYVGYKTESVEITLDKDTVITMHLNISTTLQEVTVVGNKKNAIKSSQMSVIEIPIKQMQSIPKFLGETDIIKALQLLPGVQGGMEGSSGMYVRGGGPDENLFILDGIPVYNVNHLFGFFSVFNTDAIKNVNLYKGGFPARFGGRLSSVVDIRMNDGNEQEYHGNISIGLISSKLNLEGPIVKGRTTFNLSARRTYADLLLTPLIKSAMKNGKDTERASAGYYFYDLNLKLSHKLSENNRLYLSYYMGDDAFYYNLRFKKNENTQHSHWNWGNIIGALRWNSVLSNKLFMNSTVAYTRYRMDLGIRHQMKGKHLHFNNRLSLLSGVDDWTAKVDFDYRPSPNHDIKFGTNYTYHTFRPIGTAMKLENDFFKVDTLYGDPREMAHETVVYVEDDISWGEHFKSNIGLHHSFYTIKGKHYSSLQPRLSARWLMNDRFSMKGSYAYMTQYIHLLSNSLVTLPTDMWVPATERILPMQSHQYAFGLFYDLPQWAAFSIEGYYKTMNNLIEYKDGATFMGSTAGWEEKVAMGRGWSYGVELLAQRNFGKTTGWIGYTWAKADRLFDRPGEEINMGKVFPAKYDKRHDFSITATHQLSERIELSGSWVFSTGHCATLPMQYYSPPQNIPQDIDIPIFNSYLNKIQYLEKRNNYRYSNYHRLDLGVNFNKKTRRGVRTWNISVYNAYNQKNPFVVYEEVSEDRSAKGKVNKKMMQLSIFTIIPSISYSFKF